MKLFNRFLKSEPSVGDVHVETTGKNPKRKAKPFLSTLADAKKPEDDTDTAKADFESSFQIVKFQEDQQMIFGWASISAVNGEEIVDKQDDIIPINELEKAAYDFVLYSREHGDMHEKRDVGRLIESLVFTPEKEACGLIAKNAAGETIHGWWTGFRVFDPEVWKSIKRGEKPELSIGGKARDASA